MTPDKKLSPEDAEAQASRTLLEQSIEAAGTIGAVSYTHLTLPTIYSV